MEKPSPDTIVGIDLGTTNSCAAVATGAGQVKLIPYKSGEYTIPSIFAIDDKGHELVGHEAKRQWQLNPRNTLYATKRLIGRSPRDGVVETVQRSVQYRVRGGTHHSQASAIRCWERGPLAPLTPWYSLSFRVARTQPPL